MLLWVLTMIATAEAACVDGQVSLDGAVQPDLTAALAAAAEGSTIEICAGTYVGTFASAVPVHVVAPQGPDLTVLDGASGGTVLTLPGGSSLTGITVTGGASDGDGGGLLITSAGETLLQDVHFDGNVAAGSGGALAAPDGATLIAQGSRFTGNTAIRGGALRVGEDGGEAGVLVDLTGSVVSGNTAVGADGVNGYGGGMLGFGATVIGGEISQNQSVDYWIGWYGWPGIGGGIALRGDGALHGVTVTGNAAEGGGAGIHLYGDGAVVLDGVLVEGNAATYGNGGGVRVSGNASVSLVGSVIRANDTWYDGGGVAIDGDVAWTGGEIVENTGWSGGGLFIERGSPVIADVELRDNVATYYGGGAGSRWFNPWFGYAATFTGCLFEGNVAGFGSGGGLDLGMTTTIVDSELVDNLAEEGGAMALYGWPYGGNDVTTYTLDGVEMKANEATVAGGAVLVTYGAVVTASGVEAKANTAPVAGGVMLDEGSLDLTNGELAGNTPDDVWVVDAAAAYVGLEGDVVCTAAGCVGG